MVHFAPLIGAAALASVVAAVPMPQYGSSSNNNNGYNNGNSNSNSYNNGYNNGYNSGSSNSNSYNNGNQGYSSSSDNSYSTSTDDSTSTSSAYNSYSTSSYGNSNSYSNSYSSSSDNSYSSSTSTDAATSTYSSSYSMPSYGSGSSSWSNSNYEDCVQQCMATYGGGMSSVSNTYGSSDSSNSGSSSGGATHTIMVAPTQGVYRYVPFYTAAQPGDTVRFIWGSSEHTVTKSSALELCNASSAAPIFKTGEQSQGFTFDLPINDTNPVFFYCGTPDHCEKGMFGMINANTTTGSTSASSMLPSMISNNSITSAMYAYQQNVSNGNSQANSWGSSLDMSGMPSWSMPYMAQNMMYTRTFLAANPEVINSDGTIDMSKAQSWNVPKDLAAQLNAAGAGAAEAAAPASTSSSSTGSAASTTATHKSGAGSITAPRLVAALAAVAVTVFAL